MAYLVLLRGAPGAGKTEVGKAFANAYGWTFVELDEIKRARGDIRKADPGAFSQAGTKARTELDGGANVVAEEYFLTDEWIQLFLQPTDRTLNSPDVSAVWLACDGRVAAQRKGAQGLMSEELAAMYNAQAAGRLRIANEIVIDTTLLPTERVVEEMAAALTKRGLKLVPRE